MGENSSALSCGADIYQIAALLKGHRYNVGVESDLKRAVLTVLTQSSIDCIPEFNLGPKFGRIDCYLPKLSLGIEMKIKDSPSQILRQLHRYSGSPAIEALLLLTTRPRLTAVPPAIGGKQLVVASIWEGFL